MLLPKSWQLLQLREDNGLGGRSSQRQTPPGGATTHDELGINRRTVWVLRQEILPLGWIINEAMARLWKDSVCPSVYWAHI